MTATSTAILPDLLDLPVIPVYIATALTFAAFNFLFFRFGIFHAER